MALMSLHSPRFPPSLPRPSCLHTSVPPPPPPPSLPRYCPPPHSAGASIPPPHPLSPPPPTPSFNCNKSAAGRATAGAVSVAEIETLKIQVMRIPVCAAGRKGSRVERGGDGGVEGEGGGAGRDRVGR